MNIPYSQFLIFSALLVTALPVFSEELSDSEITERFSGKTMQGHQLQRNYIFKRYYNSDGEVIDISDFYGERVGEWYTKNDKLCHHWEGKNRGKCRKMHADGDVLHLYNKRYDTVTMHFTPVGEGNKLNETTVAEIQTYDGPIIDGHSHLGSNYDLPFMINKNERDNITSMVLMPRLWEVRGSSGTTEEEASEIAQEYSQHVWMLVGLQRGDLFEMDWNSPDDWWNEWKQWAQSEISSGRRRGLGELTARHHAYTNSSRAERDYPLDSLVVNDLLTISADSQRPLIIHAEGEKHVLKAMKTQLARHPDAIVVWAHACGRSKANVVAEFLGQFSNLYCDLSNMTDTGNYGSLWPRKEDWMSKWEDNGQILSEWIKIMEKYPNRFFLGMDSNEWRGWAAKGIKSRRGRISRFRSLLPQLSEQTIKSITIGVPAKLFGDR